MADDIKRAPLGGRIPAGPPAQVGDQPPNMAGAIDNITAPPPPRPPRMTEYARDTMNEFHGDGLKYRLSPEQYQTSLSNIMRSRGSAAGNEALAGARTMAAENATPVPPSRAVALGQQNFQTLGGPRDVTYTYDGRPNYGSPATTGQTPPYRSGLPAYGQQNFELHGSSPVVSATRPPVDPLRLTYTPRPEPRVVEGFGQLPGARGPNEAMATRSAPQNVGVGAGGNIPPGAFDEVYGFYNEPRGTVRTPRGEQVYEGVGAVGREMPPNAAQQAAAYEHFGVGPRGGGAGGGGVPPRAPSGGPGAPPRGGGLGVMPILGEAIEQYNNYQAVNNPRTLGDRFVQQGYNSGGLGYNDFDFQRGDRDGNIEKVSNMPGLNIATGKALNTFEPAARSMYEIGQAGAPAFNRASEALSQRRPIEAAGAAARGVYDVGKSALVDHGAKPLGQAFYDVGDQLYNGIFGKPTKDTSQITMDKAGNFSRAPANKAEYDYAMGLKYGAGRGEGGDPNSEFPDQKAPPINKTPATFAVDARDANRQAQRPGAGAGGRPGMPTMKQSYDDYVRSQPLDKLDAEGYARRAQLEIDRLRPEREARNREMAESYATQHPDQRGQDKVLANMGHLLTGTGSLEHARAQASTEQQRADATTTAANAQAQNALAAALGARTNAEIAKRGKQFNPDQVAAFQLWQDKLRQAQALKQRPGADASAIDADVMDTFQKIFRTKNANQHNFSEADLQMLEQMQENARK